MLIVRLHVGRSEIVLFVVDRVVVNAGFGLIKGEKLGFGQIVYARITIEFIIAYRLYE